MDTFFDNLAKIFPRSFGILPPVVCEDRSFNGIETSLHSSEEDNLASLQHSGCGDDPRANLTLFYKMIIAPVANSLKRSEIIIVLDRHLYRVLFPALLDGRGKYIYQDSHYPSFDNTQIHSGKSCRLSLSDWSSDSG